MASRTSFRARHDLAGYAHIAPSVDHDWVQSFVLEQRLLDVPGTRIGDSLAVVESHVAETGESARTAFGDPVDYARADAPERTTRTPVDALWLAGIFVGLVGLLVTGFSTQSWFAHHTRMPITAAVVVVSTVVLVAGCAVIFASRAVLRLFSRHRVLTVSVWVALFVGIIACFMLFSDPIATLDIRVPLIGGPVLVALSAVLMAISVGTGRTTDDPITAPGEVRRRRGLWLPVLIFPLMTVLVVATAWLLQQIPTWF